MIGADLDKESDIEILASEGGIEIDLLLEKHEYLCLLRETHVEPYIVKGGFLDEQELQQIQQESGYLKEIQGDSNVSLKLVNVPVVMIPKYFFEGDLNTEIEKVEFLRQLSLQVNRKIKKTIMN